MTGLRISSLDRLLTRLSRPRTLRRQLLHVSIAALAPILLFAAALVWLAVERQREAIEEGMRSTAQALSVAVEREVRSVIASLDALSASDALETGDYDRFRAQAERFLTRHAGWITVVDWNGQHVNALLPPDQALPRTASERWLRGDDPLPTCAARAEGPLLLSSCFKGSADPVVHRD